MKQLTETELLWANLVKATRAGVRLKHSIRADRELAGLLPELEVEFNTAVKLGVALQFAAGEVDLKALATGEDDA